MILRDCTVEKLKRLSRNRQIICFGAGSNLFFLFDVYKEMKLEKKIAYVVDNDEQKYHTEIEINGLKVIVENPKKLAEIEMSKYVIVITALKYQEIFSQIQNICKNKKGICYKAPNKRYEITDLIKNIICKMPLGNVIVLNGEGDTCENTRALGKYISSQNYFGKYKLVWLCDHPERFLNTKKEVFINRKASMLAKSIFEVIRYYYYVGRAKYIIFENQFISKLRSDQISIYLNHGTPPIKATKGIINLPKDLNYALSPSDFCTKIIQEQYSINNQRILICGSPRTDTLFAESNKMLNKFLNADEFNRIILWVPTFRQRKNTNRIDTNKVYEFGIPLIETERDIEKLEEKLRETKTLLILKPHLLQDLGCIKICQSDNFRIITSDILEKMQIDVYEIMKLADAMITDYSTIGFDFMLLNRPIGYTVDDMDNYKLGFSVSNPLSLMPGKKMKTVDDLLEFVQDMSGKGDVFFKERMEINQLIHDYIDGKNSERLCELLGWRSKDDHKKL